MYNQFYSFYSFLVLTLTASCRHKYHNPCSPSLWLFTWEQAQQCSNLLPYDCNYVSYQASTPLFERKSHSAQWDYSQVNVPRIRALEPQHSLLGSISKKKNAWNSKAAIIVLFRCYTSESASRRGKKANLYRQKKKGKPHSTLALLAHLWCPLPCF